MDEKKIEELEAKGFKVGNAGDFLGVNCLICGEGMRPDGSRNYRRTTFWWWCESCEFGQVDPMPEDISEYYASGQYRKDTHDHRDMGYEYDGPGDWNYNEEEERAKGWLDYIDFPVKRHLDVGASTGKVLEVIGAETQIGVEIGPWSQYYTSYPFIEDVEGTFDLVTCLHTLEHVMNPISLLQQIADKATNQVCVEVPQPVMRQFPHLLDFREKSLLQAMGVAGLPAKIVENAYHIKCVSSS